MIECAFPSGIAHRQITNQRKNNHIKSACMSEVYERDLHWGNLQLHSYAFRTITTSMWYSVCSTNWAPTYTLHLPVYLPTYLGIRKFCIQYNHKAAHMMKNLIYKGSSTTAYNQKSIVTQIYKFCPGWLNFKWCRAFNFPRLLFLIFVFVFLLECVSMRLIAFRSFAV